MGHFENICLLKAPQYFENPHPFAGSDLTEICYLASVVESDVNSVAIPGDYYNSRIYKTFETHLKTHPVDLVGISSLTGAFNNALRLAELAKQHDKYVVMGGYHPSAMPERVLSSPSVDAVVIGEGEETFRELVVSGPAKHVAGIAYKDDGNVVRTDPRTTITDLDSMPHPLRNVRPPRYGEATEDYTVDTVFTSRGCPWKCSFCANETVQKGWRARSPENVLEELSAIHDPKRTKYIKIWDANFLIDIKRVEQICDLMLERGLTNFLIWTEARVTDIIRAEGIMDKLYRVGLREVNLGVESPNAKTLKLMRKKKTPNDDAKATAILRRHNINPWGYFIIGHLEENQEDTKKYPEYAAALDVQDSIFMIMTPYPGTSIYNEYHAEDKIRSYDWDLYNNFCPVVDTRDIDAQTITRMYAYCYGRFFGVGRVHAPKFMQLGMHISIQQLIAPYSFMYYALFKVNKALPEEQIKDLIFETYRGAVGVKHSTDHGHKRTANLWLRWCRLVIIRIRHSPGKTVDIKVTHEQGKSTVTIDDTSGDTPPQGPVWVVELDDIMRVAKRLYPDRFAALASRWVLIDVASEATIPKILSSLGNRDVFISFVNLVGLLVKVLVKGAISAIVYLLRRKPISSPTA